MWLAAAGKSKTQLLENERHFEGVDGFQADRMLHTAVVFKSTGEIVDARPARDRQTKDENDACVPGHEREGRNSTWNAKGNASRGPYTYVHPYKIRAK